MVTLARITTYLLPRNGRYFHKTETKAIEDITLYTTTLDKSSKNTSAGMMAGATSPARPWFRLATARSRLNKFAPVQLWLADVTERMQLVFTRRSTYRTLHGIYEELGAFGTAGSIVLPDS